MKCTDYKPINKGALLGFATIEMQSGMVLKDCQHCESNGRQWVSPPARPMMNKDGSVEVGEDGRRRYVNVVDFKDKATRDRWSGQALAAIAARG